jgi:hypothetical protein
VSGEVEAVGNAAKGLGGATISEAVAEAVGEAAEPVQAWWEAGPAPALKLDELDARVKSAESDVLAAVTGRMRTIGSLREVAAGDAQAVEQELRATTRLSDEQDLLRDQRELARQRFEQVDAEREEYLRLVEKLDAALEARADLLSALSAAQDAVSAARDAGLAPLNGQLAEVGGDRLRITVQREPLGDRAALIAFLNESVLTIERAGQYNRMQVGERLAAMARPEELSEALVAGKPKALGARRPVGSDGALTIAEAKKLADGCVWRELDDDARVDVFDSEIGALLELAEQPVDDRVRIKLNGKAVDALSPGQRSSAMLPLIALAETDPLVIDQPEDNLDNAMVGDTLTRILADLKERRQIIVSTHNNIVVGGDAEQVIVLDSPGAHSAEVTTTGSIDDEPIIHAVLTIMEGGREAFIARSKRYRVS